MIEFRWGNEYGPLDSLRFPNQPVHPLRQEGNPIDKTLKIPYGLRYIPKWKTPHGVSTPEDLTVSNGQNTACVTSKSLLEAYAKIQSVSRGVCNIITPGPPETCLLRDALPPATPLSQSPILGPRSLFSIPIWEDAKEFQKGLDAMHRAAFERMLDYELSYSFVPLPWSGSRQIRFPRSKCKRIRKKWRKDPRNRETLSKDWYLDKMVAGMRNIPHNYIAVVEYTDGTWAAVKG